MAAYQMELKPHLDQSPEDCVAEVCTHFSDFAVKYYQERNQTLLPLAFDGRCERPEDGHCLVTARYASAKHTMEEQKGTSWNGI